MSLPPDPSKWESGTVSSSSSPLSLDARPLVSRRELSITVSGAKGPSCEKLRNPSGLCQWQPRIAPSWGEARCGSSGFPPTVPMGGQEADGESGATATMSVCSRLRSTTERSIIARRWGLRNCGRLVPVILSGQELLGRMGSGVRSIRGGRGNRSEFKVDSLQVHYFLSVIVAVSGRPAHHSVATS